MVGYLYSRIRSLEFLVLDGPGFKPIRISGTSVLRNDRLW